MASRINASYVSLLQRFFDVFAIYLSLFFVFKINNLSINNQTLLALLSIVSIFQLMGGLTDFYRSWRGISLGYELLSCFKNVSVSMIVFYLMGLLFSQIDIIHALELYIFLLVFIGIFRFFIRIVYSVCFRILDNSNSVIVVGDSLKAKKLFMDLNKSKWTGYNPLGIFSFKEHFNHAEYHGDIGDVIERVTSNNIRKVYIVIDKNNLQKAEQLLEVLSDTTCSTIVIPDLFNFDYLYSRVEEINGVPAIPLFDTRIKGVNTLLKRIEDIFFSSVILFLISPILIIIGIAIKLNSNGPVFFKQTRYGLNGKPILVYKFRTMTVMENGVEVKQAVKNDPRVTSVGRFLRKTSLDELPQFFNVIKGDMSVVGPRPHAVAHNEEYRKLIMGYMLRHKVKPGITGLAQIKGWRGETDTLDKMEKRVECDLEYIRTWSIWLDIKLIILTVFHGFINKAAY